MLFGKSLRVGGRSWRTAIKNHLVDSSLLLLVVALLAIYALLPKTSSVNESVSAAPAQTSSSCCGSWGQKSNTGPSTRNEQAAVYAARCNRVILFGGRTAGAPGPGNATDETWEWNGGTMAWTQVTTIGKPPARGGHAMAYDSRRNRVVLFGGYNNNFGGLNDTWEYDCVTKTWTQRTPAASPPARHAHDMAYDPILGLTVLYAGSGPFQDTWTWDGTNWAQVAGANQPGIRVDHSMAFDGQRVILFGGTGASGLASAETWGFNGTAWTQLATAGPHPRYRHAMAYDPGCRRVILFAGSSSMANRANDTWEWDGSKWCEVAATTPPVGREYGAMAFDGRGIIVYGGLNNSLANLGDTWRFNCNRPYTYRAGRMDRYRLPKDKTFRGTELSAAFPNATWKDFDDTATDAFVGQTFYFPGSSNIVHAELEIHMKPLPGITDNDTIYLGLLNNAGNFAWAQRIKDLPVVGGSWDAGVQPNGRLFIIDLDSLPNGLANPPNNSLLAKMNADKRLDILVQDDSAVDYVKLRVTFCPRRIYFAGLPHESFNGANLELITSATGQEQLRATPNSAPIPGQDIRVDLGQVEGWQANLLPTEDLRGQGKVMESWIKGRVGGVDNQFIGKARIAGNGNSATFTVDFSTIGSATSQIELFGPNGQLVGSFTAPNGAQMILSNNCPDGLRPVQVKTWKLTCEPKNDVVGVYLYSTICVSSGLGGFNEVSFLRVTAINPTQPRDYVSEAVLCGTGLNNITVTGEGVQFGGKPSTAHGNAGLESAGGSLTVSGIGSNGEDGVKFDLGTVDGFSVDLDEIDPMSNLPEGASVKFEPIGMLANGQNSPLGSLAVARKFPWDVIRADVAPIGGPAMRVVAFNGGAQVANVAPFTGDIGASASPSRVNFSNGQNSGYELEFPEGTSFMIGNLTVQGNTLQVLAANQARVDCWACILNVTASLLPELTLSGLTVTPSCGSAITISPASLPAGTSGTAYPKTQLTASGGIAPYNFSAAGLPNGLTLSPGGELSGTPSQSGNFQVTVVAKDDNGCEGRQVYTLTVANGGCTTITVNPATIPNGRVGQVYNQTFTASGGAAPYTFRLSTGLVMRGTVLSPQGLLSGTPQDPGTFNFTVESTDANGCKGTRAYTVTISSGGLMFYPLSKPLHLLDTRAAAARPGPAFDMPNAKIKGLVTNGTPRVQQARVTFDGVTIPANAQAIVGTATVINNPDPGAYTGTGNVTFYPNGKAKPEVSNLNYAAGQTISNSFTVGLGDSGAFDIFAYSDVHLVIDVVGYYAPPGEGGLYFHPLGKPVRKLETRPELFYPGCETPRAKLQAGSTRTMQGRFTCDGVTIPAAAQALVGNLTAVNANGSGQATMFGGDLNSTPLANSLSYVSTQAIPNAFVTRLAADGNFKLFVSQTTDMLVDVTGYFSPEAQDVNGQGLLLTLLDSPVRKLETRPETFYPGCITPRAPLTGGTETVIPVHGTCDSANIPTTARAVIGNATVVNFISQGSGNVTLYPTAFNRPEVSNLNYVADQVIPNAFTVGLSNDGRFTIYVFSSIHLLIDISGYYAP